MNENQARMFREAHDAYVRRLDRMSKAALATEYQTELGERGMFSTYPGHYSKDELINALVGLRYPIDQLNEAIHVMWHQNVVWDGCKHCQPSRVPSGTGWPS